MPKKADALAYRELKRDISAGRLGNLYIFHGEETYLRDYCLEQMKKKLLTGGLDDFNFHVLDAPDFSLQRLQELVEAMPMMSERTLVLVRDYDLYKGGKSTLEAMTTFLADLPEYVCLIFLYDTLAYKPDSRTKLAKLVQKTGKTVAFLRQDQKSLTDWIIRRFQARGCAIQWDDAVYLTFVCGDLMTGLASEIEKLSAYAAGRTVTRQDIDTVAIPQLDAVIYQLTDAIAAGQADRAFSVLGDLLHMQEAPIKILAAIGKHFRQLYTARLALENHQSKAWLMELWNMRKEFPAEKQMRNAQRFSLDWCRGAVIRCWETDRAMKSTGAEASVLLTELLLSLFCAPPTEKEANNL